MHSLMMPETRSKSEIMDEKTGAKGPVDHNYIKMSNKSKQSTPSQKVQQCFSRNVIAASNHLKDYKRSSGVSSVSPLTGINVWILPGMFLKHLPQLKMHHGTVITVLMLSLGCKNY